MNKKFAVLILSGILALGGLTTSLVYAKTNNKTSLENTKIKVKRVISQNEKRNSEIIDDMIDSMRGNGYGNMAAYMENHDYEAMDRFMENMTDEDYENMIEFMRENGYENMAEMMEGVSREEMIEMRNSMGGAAGCHSGNSNMMSDFQF